MVFTSFDALASLIKNMFKNRKSGFTLIELLVVIAIIGILSSVVLASLNSARQKSRDAARISDIKQMQIALELYFDDNNGYPTAVNYAGLDLVPYMPTMPTDPSVSVAGTGYYYQAAAGTDYCLGAAMEGTPPGGGTASCLAGGGATDALPAAANYAVAP